MQLPSTSTLRTWACSALLAGAPTALAVGAALANQLSSPLVVASAAVVGALTSAIIRRSILSPEELALQRRALIAESTTLGVVMTDRQGRIQWLNEGFTKLSGYTLDEVAGKIPGQFLQCDKSDPEVIKSIGSAVKAGTGFQGEIWNRDKNGEDYLIALEIRPLRLRRGDVVGFVAHGMDVTAQRRVEEDLALNERRMRHLLEETNVTVWEYDPAIETFLYVSPQAECFGYPMEHWYKKGFFAQIVHPDDRDETVRVCVDATARGEDHEMTYRMLSADGHSTWIRDIVRVMPQPDGSVLLRGVFVDVTQQKESELELARLTDALRAEAERSDLALESGNLGRWDWYPKEDKLTVNGCWADMVGCRLEELSGTTSDWSERLHPLDQADAFAALDAHIAGESSVYEARFRLRHAEGHWIWTRARGKVVQRDPSGAPLRIVGFQMDQTADVEREAELERLRSEADAANRSKSEFLANMSHEIRTPLTAILGYTELLFDEAHLGADATERVEMLGTIRSSGTHLLTVINDILDLSKIEADRLSIESIKTDLPVLIQEVSGLARSQAATKGVALDVVVEGEIPSTVLTDPTRVRQVLINLLGNAVKFTEMGEITLRVACPDRNRLRVEVQDSGPGIELGAQKALFRPFSQADNTVTRRFGGSGLGLSISRRLANLMGGHVALDWSKPGTGSCFSVEVPVEVPFSARWISALDQASARPITSAAKATGDSLSGRILLVEDGPVNQRLIAAILRRAGAEVWIAENGQVALDQLADFAQEGQAIDLVVSDMQMPVMDGYTLARTLVKRQPSLPVIALTAHAMSEDEQRCLDAGCVAYTTKPVQRAELIGLCDRYLRMSQQQRKAS